MKKFVKAMTVFAALAMLGAGFVSCSNDDGDDTPAPTTYKCGGCGTDYATQAEKEACAKQQGCPKYVSANQDPATGVWDFTTADTYNLTTTETEYHIDLANTAASNVTLKFDGNVKWGNGGDIASFWVKKASAYVAGSEESKAGGWFTAVLTGSATVKIKVCGNGTADAKRWICVCKEDGTVIDGTYETNLESGTEKEVTASLTAGTYKIYTSGTRVNKISFE